MSYDHLEHLRKMREHRINEAIKALPESTPGDWWCDGRGEMHNDAMGSVKLAKDVSGGNPPQRDANRKLLSAARDLAIEVERLRNQPPIHMTADELTKFLKDNPSYRVPMLDGIQVPVETLRKWELALHDAGEDDLSSDIHEILEGSP